MNEAQTFAPLLIVVMLAFLVPLLLSSVRSRLAVPIVVGEIIAGMIVGGSGFGWVVPDNGALTLLKELGFVLLCFFPAWRSIFAACAAPIPIRQDNSRVGGQCLLQSLTLEPPCSWPPFLPGA